LTQELLAMWKEWVIFKIKKGDGMKQEWKFNYRKNGNIKERIKRGDDFTEEEKMKLMGRKHLDMNILKKWKM